MKQHPTKNNPKTADLKRVGLARALSKLGCCSRSQASEWIIAGRVSLNGSVRRNPETPVHLVKDRIEVDGQRISASAKIYLMLNKPRGIVTTAADEKGRDTVYSLLPKGGPWLAPVGRLDQASEGLLLFTNDSEWAARITSPETHLDKTYHVQISVLADERLLQTVRDGVRTNDGDLLSVKQARLLRSGDKNSWVEIILDEGKNRQIRRIFEHLSIELLRLLRVAIGPLPLGDLTKGASRSLQPGEKQALDLAMRAPASSLLRR